MRLRGTTWLAWALWAVWVVLFAALLFVGTARPAFHRARAAAKERDL